VYKRFGGQRGHGKSRELYSLLWERKGKSSIVNRIFCTHRIISAVKRVEFVSDRVLYIYIYIYIFLRGRWCNIIALNVYAPREGKSDDPRESFYEE